MNNLFLMLLFFLHGSLILNAQNTIEAEISNFASDKGVAQIGLFNTETSFLEKVYKGKEVKIKDKKAVAIFTDIPDGTYAISAFHDKNKDKKNSTHSSGSRQKITLLPIMPLPNLGRPNGKMRSLMSGTGRS